MENGYYYFSHFDFEIKQDQNSQFLCYGKKEGKTTGNNATCENVVKDMNKNYMLPDDMVCLLKLLNGETQYPKSQFNALKKMLFSAKNAITGNFNVTKASREPEYLVTTRRKNHKLDQSNLEIICEELACEHNTSKRAFSDFCSLQDIDHDKPHSPKRQRL